MSFLLIQDLVAFVALTYTKKESYIYMYLLQKKKKKKGEQRERDGEKMIKRWVWK